MQALPASSRTPCQQGFPCNRETQETRPTELSKIYQSQFIGSADSGPLTLFIFL